MKRIDLEPPMTRSERFLEYEAAGFLEMEPDERKQPTPRQKKPASKKSAKQPQGVA